MFFSSCHYNISVCIYNCDITIRYNINYAINYIYTVYTYAEFMTSAEVVITTSCDETVSVITYSCFPQLCFMTQNRLTEGRDEACSETAKKGVLPVTCA